MLWLTNLRLFQENPDTHAENFIHVECALHGQRNENLHKLSSGKAKRVKRGIPKEVKEEIGKRMLDKKLRNKEMQTQLLDKTDYEVLKSGNYSTCPSNNQMKECRRLARRGLKVDKGSLLETHSLISELSKLIRDPSRLHHGFLFDFRWAPLSGLLTTYAHLDLFIKACQDIGEYFRLHVDATGKEMIDCVVSVLLFVYLYC